MVEREYLTLKDAAAEYRTSQPGISRLVRRLGVRLYPNPRDLRSKLVKKTDLDAAMGRRASQDDQRDAPRSAERIRRMADALEASRRFREELERNGVNTIPAREALRFVRGEIELDDLP